MPFGIGAAILGAGVLGAGASIYGANKQAGAAGDATSAQLGMFNQTQQNLAPWMQGGTAALSDLESLLGITPGTPGTPGTPARMGGLLGRQMLSPATAGTPGTPTSFDPNAPLVKPFSLQDFQQSPAYQFNLEQGMNAINKGANARGNYYAPQTLQDLGKFSQGLASNEFQNAFSNYNTNQNNIFNRLQTLSGSGQNAAANLGTAATNTGQQIGSNITSAGAAQAGGLMGAANALSGSIGSGYNAYLMNQILAQQQGSTYRPNYGNPNAFSIGGLPGGADY